MKRLVQIAILIQLITQPFGFGADLCPSFIQTDSFAPVSSLEYLPESRREKNRASRIDVFLYLMNEEYRP